MTPNSPNERTADELTDEILLRCVEAGYVVPQGLHMWRAEIKEALERERTARVEAEKKLTGNVLYTGLANTLIKHILENGREGQHDIELTLLEIIAEKKKLQSDLQAAQETIKKLSHEAQFRRVEMLQEELQAAQTLISRMSHIIKLARGRLGYGEPTALPETIISVRETLEFL